ncbi:MAG: gamma carbonic anhydrase family protein [Proteobacteria bacterium]|nr:gamma carbonic anhydrase family protein [Pseudomonadota bacterium]
MKYALDGVRVSGEDYFIAPSAAVIGKVHLAKNASVWWNAVLRGDNEAITVGENSNVQDGCILHTDPGQPTIVGRNVTIGHGAILHGCTIGEGSLVGIGAVVLNGVKVGRNCVIGARALIPDGKEIPDNSVVMGTPGRVIRQTTEADTAMIAETVAFYVANQDRFRKGLAPDD